MISVSIILRSRTLKNNQSALGQTHKGKYELQELDTGQVIRRLSLLIMFILERKSRRVRVGYYQSPRQYTYEHVKITAQ